MTRSQVRTKMNVFKLIIPTLLVGVDLIDNVC